MNHISLNPSVLKDQSKQLDNLAKSYEGFYQKVEAEFGSINENWGSDLVTNFVDKITKFKSTETELIESLKSAAKKAEVAACLYEQADASLKTSDVISIDEEAANAIIKAREGLSSIVELEGKTYYSMPNNMKCSFKQGNYNMMVHGSKGIYNGGCLATCYAIGGSILTGQSRSPMDYWNSKSELANTGSGDAQVSVSGETASGEESFKTIYNHVVSGKPVIIHFTHEDTGGQHYVVITGVSSTANVDALTKSDFIVADPGTGTYRSLDNCMNSYTNANMIGYRMFK